MATLSHNCLLYQRCDLGLSYMPHRLDRRPPSIDWLWRQWKGQAAEDKIVLPPSIFAEGIKWTPIFCKEGMTVHIILREHLQDGSTRISPEDASLPVMTPYGTRAILKIRMQTPDTAELLRTF
jgi:hypothetical protein